MYKKKINVQKFVSSNGGVYATHFGMPAWQQEGRDVYFVFSSSYIYNYFNKIPPSFWDESVFR